MKRFTLITLLALVTVPATAHAVFPGKNGRIAFVRTPNHIWTMNADGTAQVNLTNGRADESDPAWSPDGTKIAFVRNRSIWVMNADGSDPTPLVPVPPRQSAYVYDRGLQSPTWSPDGSKLAFVDAAYGELGHFFSIIDLYTVNADGSGIQLLIQEGSHPRWSPDGSKIGYTWTSRGDSDVAWVAADRSNSRLVTQSYSDYFIDWRPDGSKLTGYGYCCAPSASYGVYTINPDGTGQTASNPNLPSFFRWSPDAAWIVYEAPGSPYPNADIFIASSDGTVRQNITNTPTAVESQPDWQSIPIIAYPRPRGATPLHASLVPAYAECAEANRTHGAPLSHGSCHPPSQASGYLTMGTPDANGRPANANSFVRFAAAPGNAATPTVDEADVGVLVRINDVRSTADLSDYTGELELRLDLRITDKDNTPAPGGPSAGTVQDTTFPVTVSCAATDSTTVGSDCNLHTSIDAVSPGTVKENRRSIWQLGQVQVYDGGSDGLASTQGDNTLFLDQGLFTP